MDNLALLELPFFDLLEGNFLADNALVAVNAVLLDVVGEDTLNHVAFVLSSDLVHGLSDFNVGCTFLDQPLSSSKGVVGGVDHVSLCLVSLGVANDNSVSRGDCEAVNVGTANELSNITSLHFNRVGFHGGEVADHVVKRDAGGESDATLNLLGLLAVVDFVEFFLDVLVTSLADSVNVGVNLNEGDKQLHGT